MRMATIILAFLDGNISIDHKSLSTIQSTHAQRIHIFEMLRTDNARLTICFACQSYAIFANPTRIAVDSVAISFSYAFSIMVDCLIIIKSSICWLLWLSKCVRRILSRLWRSLRSDTSNRQTKWELISSSLSTPTAVDRVCQKPVPTAKIPLLSISKMWIVWACVDYCIVDKDSWSFDMFPSRKAKMIVAILIVSAIFVMMGSQISHLPRTHHIFSSRCWGSVENMFSSTRVFLPVVSVSLTTFVTKVATQVRSVHTNGMDGISMADVLLPRSTLRRYSFAGFIFIFIFSRQRKGTQQQQQQQHGAEGSLENDVIIWYLDCVRINTTINQIYTATAIAIAIAIATEEKDITRTGCKRKQPPKYTLYRPVVEPKPSIHPQSAYSLHGGQDQ